MFVIGLMSGTSMDGIDAAILETDGEKIIKHIENGHFYLPYDSITKALLRSCRTAVNKTGKPDVEKAKEDFEASIKLYLKNEGMLDFNINHTLEVYRAYLHGEDKKNQLITYDEVVTHFVSLNAQAVEGLLKKMDKTGKDIDIIASHGQTVGHSPTKHKITVQLDNGQLLADLTGILVVNDFRSYDVSLDGQGAPLAPFYHQALAARDGLIPVAVMNCGGISNGTFITGDTPNDVKGFDTGPGVYLIDTFVKLYTEGKEQMDTDGNYGMAGTINELVITELDEKFNEYLKKAPPKSLDTERDLMPLIEIIKLHFPLIQDPSKEDYQKTLNDACATLAAFTARNIINGLNYIEKPYPTTWILAGGGWNNKAVRKELEKGLEAKIGDDVKVKNADDVGWSSRKMEAEIFAWFGPRSLKNLSISGPGTTGVHEPVSGGHAHKPQKAWHNPVIEELLEKNPQVLKGYGKTEERKLELT